MGSIFYRRWLLRLQLNAPFKIEHYSNYFSHIHLRQVVQNTNRPIENRRRRSNFLAAETGLHTLSIVPFFVE